MRQLRPSRSVVLSTDFLKPKPTPPKTKVWGDIRHRYHSAKTSVVSKESGISAINQDGLCMRCADLDLDAIFDEVMIPVSNYSPWEQVEEIMKLGILSPGCSLCAIFGHCSDIDETMWTYDVPGEFSYSLLKCSSRAILEHNAVDSGNAWIPENFLTVCWRWSDDGDKRLYDYYEQGFFVQYDPNIRPANFAAEALSQKVNFPLLCSWYNQCKETHDDCHDDADWQPVTAVFMIDCDNRKVIPRMPNMRYAALSYVWGAAALESRPSVNLDISISLPSPLPKLIEDAIVATKALSLKYLWVDRYCISDIDQELKHRQITQPRRGTSWSQ